MVAERDSVPLFDDYVIRIEIPADYPLHLPIVFEESKAIPPQYEHYYADNSLCLGVTYELMDKLAINNNSFRYFFDEYIIGYFYSVSYYNKYGCFPFGERAHGTKGIIAYYYEKFKVTTTQQIIYILGAVYNENYRGHLDCPCGSHIKGRRCHGTQILELIKSGRKNLIASDLYEIIQYQRENKR